MNKKSEKTKNAPKKNRVIHTTKKSQVKRALSQMPQMADGENSKYLSHALEIANFGEIDTSIPEEVEQRIANYFATCVKNDMKPSVAGLALSFGVTRKTIYCWIRGEDSKFMPEECRKMLEKAIAILNTQMEDYMQNGKINPASGIFLMKNNYGYVDEVKQVVEHKNPLGAEGNESELRRKYQDNIIDADFTPKQETEK